MRKSHGHEKVSVIQPPTIGPTVGASTANTPAITVARAWRATGKSKNTAEKTAGIRVPPEKPCNVRHAIRDEKLPLEAQPIDASIKIKVATKNSHRIVNKRVKNPVSGIEMISAIRYAVWIQLI